MGYRLLFSNGIHCFPPSTLRQLVGKLPVYLLHLIDFHRIIRLQHETGAKIFFNIKAVLFVICPIFANSSSSQRTWIGSLPSYTSSARSHSKLNNCVYIMDTTKLNVSSVSEMMTNNAVFLSPSISSSNSS